MPSNKRLTKKRKPPSIWSALELRTLCSESGNTSQWRRTLFGSGISKHPVLAQHEEITTATDDTALFMPQMSQQRRTRLSNLRKAHLQHPTCDPTCPKEVGLLLKAVKLSGLAFEPCAGTGSLSDTVKALSNGELQVHTQDADSRHAGLRAYGDSLSLTLREVYNIIIFSPPFVLGDMFLAWALAQLSASIIVMHISGDYWTNAPAYRHAFLAPFEQDNRMLIVNALPLVQNRKMRRCMFLVLFRDHATRDTTLIPGGSCQVLHNKV
jgi:hypothetical protein